MSKMNPQRLPLYFEKQNNWHTRIGQKSRPTGSSMTGTLTAGRGQSVRWALFVSSQVIKPRRVSGDVTSARRASPHKLWSRAERRQAAEEPPSARRQPPEQYRQRLRQQLRDARGRHRSGQEGKYRGRWPGNQVSVGFDLPVWIFSLRRSRYSGMVRDSVS